MMIGHMSPDPAIKERAKLSGYGCGEDGASKGLAGYLLIWPLTCILTQGYLTDSQRTWVHGMLHYIGSELGVRYANKLAQVC